MLSIDESCTVEVSSTAEEECRVRESTEMSTVDNIINQSNSTGIVVGVVVLLVVVITTVVLVN